MSKMLRKAVALGAVLMMAAGPALAGDSLGMYQTTDRKMDYGLELCGAKGTSLCVTLLAARDTAATAAVVPYIGKLIVNQAKPAGKNKWSGKMQIGGYELSGKLTLKPGVTFVMSGCAYVVICDDFTLIPAQ
ncbi:MAG: hypothetical protein ABIQ30_01480 [Devosia sp.]